MAAPPQTSSSPPFPALSLCHHHDHVFFFIIIRINMDLGILIFCLGFQWRSKIWFFLWKWRKSRQKDFTSYLTKQKEKLNTFFPKLCRLWNFGTTPFSRGFSAAFLWLFCRWPTGNIEPDIKVFGGFPPTIRPHKAPTQPSLLFAPTSQLFVKMWKFDFQSITAGWHSLLYPPLGTSIQTNL